MFYSWGFGRPFFFFLSVVFLVFYDFFGFILMFYTFFIFFMRFYDFFGGYLADGSYVSLSPGNRAATPMGSADLAVAVLFVSLWLAG